GARDEHCGKALGSELQARHMDAGAPRARRAGCGYREMAHGWERGVARRRLARGFRGAVHARRHHADEPPASGTRPRPRLEKAARVAREVGQAPCRAHRPEPPRCDALLYALAEASLASGPEAFAQVLDEEIGLLESGEVPAARHLGVANDVVPTLR